MPNLLNSGIYIAFDFGMKHIGYAIGQKTTQTASSGGTIAAKSGIPEWQKLDAIIKEWQPEALIVGWPLNMDGTLQPLTEHVSQFAKSLEEHYQLPVHFTDERLTTKEARERLFTVGGYKSLTPSQVNAMAAKIILENWLHSKV